MMQLTPNEAAALIAYIDALCLELTTRVDPSPKMFGFPIPETMKRLTKCAQRGKRPLSLYAEEAP